MASDKQDRRTEKTRQALMQAFMELAPERGYGALRIGDLVDRANVGRSTFYEHFAGKDDLLSQSLAHPFEVLAATVDPAQSAEPLVQRLVHFREQRHWARVLFSGPVRKIMTRKLAEMIAERLTAVMPAGASAVPSSVLAFQLAGSHLALIEGWLWGGVSCSAETIAQALRASASLAVDAGGHGPAQP